ncbi:methyltransferase family protein [Candidatus Zixiibacteriota bacterium]
MPVTYKIVVFAIVSVGFIWLSWSSLRDWRSHGFYRFFAFEAIAAIVLLNLNYWFKEPFGLHQLVSWFLLIISLFLVVHSYLMLRTIGKPDSQRDDPSLMGIEKTTTLVTVGAYRFIRHPMYSAGLIGTWGVFFKHPSWIGICLALATTVFFTMTARMEEAENVRFFGPSYQSYMKRTRMFIPFFF